MKDLADSDPLPSEMSTRTPVVLNGCVLLVTGLVLFCLRESTGFESLVVLMAALLVFILANGFMVVKALRRREYHLAILYFLFVVGAVAFFSSINGPTKIGG
ncbi:MAG TPA: hypothetical protein VF690_19765 [Hymenobacter sp.]|jgi:uncharacterized membrane protein SirB2